MAGIQGMVKTHGHVTFGKKSPTYRVWEGMKARCSNKNQKNYAKYGALGIVVCKRWMKFENFLVDMGERPEGLTLDRVNGKKGYSKSNCRWATYKQQMNNTKRNVHLTFKGETRTVAGWGDYLKVDPKRITRRLKHGWSVERTLTTA